MYGDMWVNNQVLENQKWRTGAILNFKQIAYYHSVVK